MQKHTYVVAEGIPVINGKAVPENREIEMTEREALFDLSLGRVALKNNAPAKSGGKKAKPGTKDDQDNPDVGPDGVTGES